MAKRRRIGGLPPKEIDPVAFAARLRVARGALGWSQTELGRRVGVTQRAIYRIEIAAVRPRDDTRARIDAAFKLAGVRFEELDRGAFKLVVPETALRKPPGRSTR
jgi:transcriptional regulator with XRE-family HTH domain